MKRPHMALQIYEPCERRLVWAADRALALARAAMAPVRRRQRPSSPERILLLRLERIGDLIMTLPAIADVRALAPMAEIDLVVGEWNRPLASALIEVNRVETLDASWLVRGSGGQNLPRMLARARAWRGRGYDLALNFEPDIRSNLLLAACGARWTAGYSSGGGGPLLDQALDFDPRTHTTDNARRLVTEVFGRHPPPRDARLALPDSVIRAAVNRVPASSRDPLIALHVSGGRPIKQWEPLRFAELARRLALELDATLVLTGGADDQPLVEIVAAAVPAVKRVCVAGNMDLLELAALLARVDLLVTGDTGPMHLAAAVGTPVVAIFGPSDPVRYAPRGPADRVVRVDLPCSPCNRIRLPPDRCVGHTPDCLALVTVQHVFEAVDAALSAAGENLDGEDRRRSRV